MIVPFKVLLRPYGWTARLRIPSSNLRVTSRGPAASALRPGPGRFCWCHGPGVLESETMDVFNGLLMMLMVCLMVFQWTLSFETDFFYVWKHKSKSTGRYKERGQEDEKSRWTGAIGSISCCLPAHWGALFWPCLPTRPTWRPSWWWIFGHGVLPMNTIKYMVW